MKLRYFSILSLLAALSGCYSPTTRIESTTPEHTDAAVITRIGVLPTVIHQHPLIVGSVISEGYQGYLDLIEDGKSTRQIIVVYPNSMKRPAAKNRLIEVKGVLHSFTPEQPLHGLHKRTYDNEAIEVYEWKYK